MTIRWDQACHQGRFLLVGICLMMVSLEVIAGIPVQSPPSRPDRGGLPVVDRVTSPKLAWGWDSLQALVAMREKSRNPSLLSFEGVLEQASVVVRPLAEGGGEVGEWFLRLDGGTTMAFAVESPPSPVPAVGRRVQMVGVTAGFLEAVGRDGTKRTWGLFASRFVEVLPASTPLAGMSGVVGLVLFLLVGWVVLVAWTRRSRGPLMMVEKKQAPVDVGESGDLPEDPVEAMTRLAARHHVGVDGYHDEEIKDASP